MINTTFCFSLLLTIGLLSVVGCERAEVVETTNSQPVIDRVVVPDEVKAGETVQLKIIAHDADGDELSYNWEVSAGTVEASGIWTVPAAATSATVMVHVSDGVNTLVTSSKISVKIITPSPEGMVAIPAGEFQMGSVDPEADNDEKPVHTVYLDAFFMDKYEVTNLEYQKFVLANPQWGKGRIDGAFHDEAYLHHWNGNDYPKEKQDHPVVHVNWYAAVAYAGWVGKRLPTEAEWEYAARGGLAGKKYPWGNVIDPGQANYDKNVGDTTAVGKYPPNGYGLYDMAGNVWEWCLDEYNEDFYSTSPRENPFFGAYRLDWFIHNFPADMYSWDWNELCMLRGGAWDDDPEHVRVAFRGGATQGVTGNYLGFRCARFQ